MHKYKRKKYRKDSYVIMGHDAQTPAEVIYTFGALRTQFSLPQTSKNSHKNSYFMQLWGEKKALGDVTASVSDSFNTCGGVAWTYKGSLDFSLHQNRLL